MYKLLFFLALTLVISVLLPAQKLNVTVNYVKPETNSDGMTILYGPDKQLTWDDFRARPNETSEAAAITNAGFGLKLSFKRIENRAELLINVNCSFSRKDSWVKKNYKTDYILNHEQKHFDIAYIHTVIFMKKLREAQYTAGNYAAVIEKIYHETAAEMSRMQNEYDGQTSHSRIPEKQLQWDLKISKQLAMALRD